MDKKGQISSFIINTHVYPVIGKIKVAYFLEKFRRLTFNIGIPHLVEHLIEIRKQSDFQYRQIKILQIHCGHIENQLIIGIFAEKSDYIRQRYIVCKNFSPA